MSLSTKISSKIIIIRRFFLSLYLTAISIGIWVHISPAWSTFAFGPSIFNKTISGQALHHLSDIYYGQHSWSWDAQKSAEKIEQHPWIHPQKLSRLSGQVHITVQEEEIHALSH